MEKFITETVPNYSLLNNITGELHEFKQVKKVNYEEFILVFLHTIPEIVKLNGSLIKLLMIVWKKSTFNPKGGLEGNTISNTAYFKDQVRANGLDINNAVINVYLNRLTTAGFLIRICKGQYMLNPKYFFKGTHTDASKMALTIEYDHSLD